MEKFDQENFKAIDFQVKGKFRDLFAFLKMKKERTKRIANAPKSKPNETYINELSARLHPKRQFLKIEKIIDETPTSKTFRLVSDVSKGTKELAYFQAGQYLSLKVNVNGFEITRPYSISSSPQDSLNNFYDITIKKIEGGFLTEYIWENWKEGMDIEASAPLGFMYYNPIRDSKQIVCIGGGSGITPFRSMVRELCFGNFSVNDVTIKILYGCSSEADILFYEEFKDIASKYPQKVELILVMSCEVAKLEGCETGFITKEIIKKYSDPTSDSYFLCGPDLMYDFVIRELEALNVSLKQIRREAYGEIRDPSKFGTYPKEKINNSYKLTLKLKDDTIIVPALANESLLVSIERAKLKIPSACRSGECQFCRSLMLSGDVWISPECDGRRAADIKFGYIHPCVSFPLTDITLELPNNDC